MAGRYPLQSPGKGGSAGRGAPFARCGQGSVGVVGHDPTADTFTFRLSLPPSFRSDHDFRGSYTISGTVRDRAGNPIATGAYVQLFNHSDDTLEQATVSDGSGNFSFNVGNNSPRWLKAYLAGSPDSAGLTINNVIPTPV